MATKRKNTKYQKRENIKYSQSKLKYLGIDLTKYVQIFVDTGKKTVKFILRSKETRIAKTILERKNKFSLPGFTIRELRNEPTQTQICQLICEKGVK